MTWRRLLVVLHRDVGFVCVGLTLVYAVSGIAVNHREHWDYNRSQVIEQRRVGSPSRLLGLEPGTAGAADVARAHQPRLVARLTKIHGHLEPPRAAFWRGGRLSLFFGEGEADVVDYLPAKGLAERTLTRDRPLIRQLNYLHLNEGRGWWTYVADLFAVALVFLAISGALVVRGRRGLRGWGAAWLVAGVALPLVAYLLLR